MKTIHIDEMDNDDILEQVSRVIADGGLACLPFNSSYRIVANLKDTNAVTKLLQSKKRTTRAPSLVFVQDRKMLKEVSCQWPAEADLLARKMWPGNLTLLLPANPELPGKVVKQLCKANGKLGVRIPDDELALRLLGKIQKPLLVSSANKEKKAGAGSPAQIRKTFRSSVEIFVDAGDLQSHRSSTVVDFKDGKYVITRPGSVSESDIDKLFSSSTK